MPRYKVAFSQHWLTGRWGFTDRLLGEMGGRALEPAGSHNEWHVPFAGNSAELGRYLSEVLNLSESRDARGVVFEIEELDPQPRRPRSPGRRKASPNLPP